MHGARLFDPSSRLRHVLDFDAKVVQSGMPGRTLCCGGVVVLELEDREVYVTVAQVIALRGRRIDLTNFFQAEALNVELLRRLQVSCADRDVPNSCLYLPPFLYALFPGRP